MYLAGKPIISHLIEKIPEDMEVIVSTNKVFQEDFFAWRNTFPHRKIKIFIEDSGSEDFKKGALGATALVIQEEKLEEDLMLLAGDNIFGFSMEDFLGSYKENPLLAVYDVKSHDEAKKFGIVITDDEYVIDFQEKPQEPKSTLASTGCYIFPKKNLSDIIHYAKEKNDDLGGIFEYMLTQGEKIHYYSFDDEWYDIGSFSAYLSAHKDKQADEKIVHEASIDKSSDLSGAVYLGKNTIVENSHIQDSIIMENCVIRNCVIRNCVIDKNTHIEGIDLNHKIIREGTEIISE